MVCTGPICGLCRCDLEDGQHVAVTSTEGQVGDIFPFTLNDARREAARPLLSTHSDRLAFWERPIGPEFFSCHTNCLAQLEGNMEIVVRVLNLNRGSCRVPQATKDSRHDWLSWVLAAKMIKQRDLKGNMCLEVCQMAAEHLVPEFATINAARILKGYPRQPESGRVVLSDSIWATYIKYEGIKYISSLSNTPSKRAVCLTPAVREDKGVKLYMITDHLGVRDLFFWQEEKPRCKEVAGIWWRNFGKLEPSDVLKFTTDGLKVRHVRQEHDAKLFDREMPQMFWPHPKYQDMYHQMPKPQNLCMRPPPSRMNYCKINDPKTIGYSILFNTSIIAIRAHTKEDVQPNRQEKPRSGISVYHPLHKDEDIDLVYWTGASYHFERAQFVMKTSEGRCLWFGKYPHVDGDWGVLDRSQSEPSYIFYDENIGWGDDHLGAEHAVHDDINFEFPVQPKVNSMHSGGTDPSLTFLTSADLTGLAEIMPCRIMQDDEEFVVGLLLIYNDGKQATLGQVHLEALKDPIQVDIDKLLCFAFDNTTNVRPVKDIKQCTPSEVADIKANAATSLLTGIEWDYINYVGSLDWWFAPQNVTLAHFNEYERVRNLGRHKNKAPETPTANADAL